MPDEHQNPPTTNQNQGEPPTSNHVIWGMTIGILLGTALGFIVFDNAGIGVAIGIVIGFVLSLGFRQAQK